jgi:hypothetical protein
MFVVEWILISFSIKRDSCDVVRSIILDAVDLLE